MPAKFINICQRLGLAANKRICFGKQFVLDANTANVTLFQFFHQAAHVVEVPVACVAVEENREVAGVRHELAGLQDLRPAGFVVVAHAQGGADREAAPPDPIEAGLLDDLRGEAVVCLHEEFKPVGFEEPAEFRGVTHEIDLEGASPPFVRPWRAGYWNQSVLSSEAFILFAVVVGGRRDKPRGPAH